MISLHGAEDELGHVTLIAEQLRRGVPGGIGTYVRELTRAVMARDDETSHQFSLFASRVSGRDDPLDELGAPVCTSVLPGAVLTRLWERGIGDVGSGGLVHAPSLAFPPTHHRLIVTVHDLAFRRVPETFTDHGRRWHERAITRAARHADHFVVPSPQIAQQLVDTNLGITNDRVSVIAEGADHLGVGDGPATIQLLQRLGVTGKFMLSVGTVEPRKNLKRLIAAFARVRNELSEPYTLVICGPDGWLHDVVESEGVVLTGYVPPGVLAGLYEQCSTVVYVPLDEGYGLPVVEAMHHGAVVVSSAVPAAVYGSFIVDPTDIRSIADGLMRASDDEELRCSLRRDAARYVADLTWTHTAQEHVDLWKRVGAA